MSPERELKCPLDDPEALRARLAVLGADLRDPEGFEDNTVWDRDSELVDRDCVLRLRRDGRGNHLTYKGPARFEDGLKVRPEHETVVADGATMERLLEALGYRRVQRYQKYRETWTLREVAVSLDRTPMGEFVEFEGDAAIEVAELCEVDPTTALSGSYLSLWAAHRERNPEAGPEMLFEATAT